MQIKLLIASVFAVMAAAHESKPKGDHGQSCPTEWKLCSECDGQDAAPGHCGPDSKYSGCGCKPDLSSYGFTCPSVWVDCSDCDGQHAPPGFCGPDDSRNGCGCRPNLSSNGHKCPSVLQACSSCDEVNSLVYAKCGPSSYFVGCGCDPNN